MKLLAIIVLLLFAPASSHALAEREVPALLAGVAGLADPGERVVRLSAAFLGTPYVANTLEGGPGKAESLVVRLDAVDCFTLLDYVEALRRSPGPGEFPARLAEVRYLGGRVAWESRRHFFTDWAAAPGAVADVTALVGGSHARQTVKLLNRREDGSHYLPGLGIQKRQVHFIPAAALDAEVLAGLRAGDYLGIYAAAPGLDVTHVGIAIRDGERWLLRHASSRAGVRRVVDEELTGYLAGRPGLVVLRPKPLSLP